MRFLITLAILSFTASACIESLVNDRGVDTADDEDDDVVVPTQITGSYLADIKARCGFKQNSATEYDVRCHLVKTDASGKEVKVEDVAPSVSISWTKPVILSGDEVVTSCRSESKALAQVCEVSTKNGQAKLQIDVVLKDSKLNQEKTETEIILLPYHVGVAAGLVMSIPNQFAQENSAKKELGFQPLKFKGADASIYGNDLCSVGERIYFDTYLSRVRIGISSDTSPEFARFIYEYDGNGMVSNFLGAGFVKEKSLLSKNRLQTQIGLSASVSCIGETLYVSDSNNFRILKIEKNGELDEFLNFSQDLIMPAQMVMDSKGKVYFLSHNAAKKSYIYQVEANGKAKKIEAKEPKPGQPNELQIADLKISDIAIWNDKLVIAETEKNTVRVLEGNEVLRTIAGTGVAGYAGDNGPAVQAKLSAPIALATTSTGELLIAEGKDGETTKIELIRYYSNMYGIINGHSPQQVLQEKLAALDLTERARVRRITKEGTIQTAYVVPRGHIVDFSVNHRNEMDFLLNRAEDTLYVANLREQQLSIVVGRQGPFITVEPKSDARSTLLGRPSSLALNKIGEIFYLDTSTSTVRRIGLDQTIYLVADLRSYINGFSYLTAMALTPSDDLLVAVLNTSQLSNNFILKITKNGEISRLKARRMGADVQFFYPTALYVNAQGVLYVGESGKVSKVDSDGRYSVIFDGLDDQNMLTGLVIKDDRNFYFTDTEHLRVVKDGTLVRLNQMGEDIRKLSFPNGVVMDSKKDLYIVDANNGTIKVAKNEDLNSPLSIFFGGSADINATCGSGQVQSQAERNKIDDAIQMSLGHLCAGHEMASIASFDGCHLAKADEKLHRMAFAQRFGDGFNIIQISKACE